MQKTETSFYIDVPLRSVMRIRVKRPSGTSKRAVLKSITQDELSRAIPVIEWDCIRDSWEIFLNSKSDPIHFTKGNPPLSAIEECLGFSFSDK